ncbi:serine/threonine protein kinase [Aeoliella sp. ICT_H6.2]|uniref:Serine/threonine protein kinase n=1 Tax=Aeoliella straminimaris TaxID=2954799 RepID=A0A9X2JHK8_9BACT|nr:serine/threonine-protein kinase [Aeoliella straminimaris]MCO6045926.1 serine/threonine protein kinase [Aeoliella straminimaris]
MAVRPPSPTIAAENDVGFAELVEQITSLVEHGQHEAADRVIEQAPEHGERLRQLLPAIEALASLEDQPDAAPLGKDLGDFRLLREIGRGGMGVVYEAEQLSLDRRVALKVLPLAATLSSTQLERFKNEARAAATLQHPNLVGVYAVGVERGVHYYAMELVDGVSLAEAIHHLKDTPSETDHEPQAAAETVAIANLSTARTKNPLQYFRDAALLIADAAEALQYAHERGIVHRDIKPGNLLLDADARVHVTDFGLARLEADAGATLTGDVLGTLRYMSPEQAAGRPGLVDARTDIYALGATLFELLTLRPVFAEKDRAKLLVQLTERQPPRLRQIDSRIPVDLETIVSKTLEKEPADRYASALELANDLRAFASDRPIAASPPSLAARAKRWAVQHSTAVAVAFGALLLASIGLAVATTMIGRERALAVANADKAEGNLDLALAALDETLAESVVGDLIVEPIGDKRRELQRRGIEFYEQFASQNGVEPTSWPAYRLLVFNERLGDALDATGNDPQQADKAYQQAIQLATELDDSPQNRARLIHCVDDYAIFLKDQGRLQDAMRESRRAGHFVDALRKDHPEFALNDYLEGKNLYNRSVTQAAADQMPEAEETCRQALPLLEQAWEQGLEDAPQRTIETKTLAMCRYNLGLYAAQGGRPQEAEELWIKSLGDWRALTLLEPLESEYHSRAGATVSNLAALANRRGDFIEGRRLAEEALEHPRRALRCKPVYEHAEDFLRAHHKHLATALTELGDYEALAAAAEQRASELPDVPFEVTQAAISLAKGAELAHNDQDLSATAQRETAQQFASRAFSLLEEARSRYDDDLAIWTVGEAHQEVGDNLAQAGCEQEARRSFESALDILLMLQAKQPPENRPQFDEAIESIQNRLSDPYLSDRVSAPYELGDDVAAQEGG